MKKIIAVLMAVTLMFTFAACGSDAGKPSGGAGSDSPEQITGADEETGQPNPAGEETERQNTNPAGTETEGQNANPTGTETEGQNTTQAGTETEGQNTNPAEATDDTESTKNTSKALVVYFSATGNTKAVAETIAGLQGAELYEIVPEQPYTDEDLNYNDRTTRATTEQNDSDARPAISGDIKDLAEYDVIYVGYPIWWGDMPRILYTFFDTYDLTGKTIAPFCTSGGSGLSGTPRTIGNLETGAEVLDGLHIRDSAAKKAEDTVSDWLEDIGQR